MSAARAPTLTVVDGHYPSFRELTGLDFKVSVVMHATDMSFADGVKREEQLQRLALAWNSHDALVAALGNIADISDATLNSATLNDFGVLFRSLRHQARAAIKAAKGEA